jgi:hypothetical protein
MSNPYHQLDMETLHLLTQHLCQKNHHIVCISTQTIFPQNVKIIHITKQSHINTYKPFLIVNHNYLCHNGVVHGLV